ncbi:hypothetical protein ABFS82_02G060200 [Erythranthe guttata]|uniref:putative pumilio homolog 8, chloroplastic n=1 Tax=Erythranthe guttata TaxID=4155 RepID=UPI00064DDA8E|nr:PREDICTED: putative pumilio homolog 8, chloroplastic [Erythranthe guttata]|eukprot:XP_012828485.1 PREDICTED: putative pumilio homolog 8, chloroplastic [Erythranthe guttata]
MRGVSEFEFPSMNFPPWFFDVDDDGHGGMHDFLKHNNSKYTYSSPLTGFNLQPDNPYPYPAHLIYGGDGSLSDFKNPNCINNSYDDSHLSRDFSRMYISDDNDQLNPASKTPIRVVNPTGLENRGVGFNLDGGFNPPPLNFFEGGETTIANLSRSGDFLTRPQFRRTTSTNAPQVGDIYGHATQNGANPVEPRDLLYTPNVVRLMPRHNGRNQVLPHRSIEPPPFFTRDDGLASHARSRGQNGKKSQISNPKCSSLEEARGYIYHMAKDQHGCRFLQRMFDEGNSRDVNIIFNEIICHVVELMMNPFGNYLVQKLLEVCDEEQRMQILIRVTRFPGDLVQISLNTHGTRVVQKLIETLKLRQHISLVISALEPGFLVLIQDLNGNHVVQRCLHCFTTEDCKFIFIAATKYCIEIATHQHGCCVLQRCISGSTGELRKNLISEISANGLMLAQDAYGNYVVQFILDLEIPSATSKLTSQFEGNYVNLSTQKFSSHVVEHCLKICNNEIRSKIIKELLSATCFEQLLQDPHANYVLQTALNYSEGRLHNSLINAIEYYKEISRSSPYTKGIFSHKLLKR